MPDISREAIVAKYTDKSRYKPEYIYGDVYVIEKWINGKLKAMKHSHEGFLVVIENCNNNYKVFTIKKGSSRLRRTSL